MTDIELAMEALGKLREARRLRDAADERLKDAERNFMHLASLVQTSGLDPNLSAVIELVSQHFGQRPIDIMGPVKTRPLTQARSAVVWLARQMVPPLSYPVIGAALRKHHTTIINLKGWAERTRLKDKAYAAKLVQLLPALTPAEVAHAQAA